MSSEEIVRVTVEYKGMRRVLEAKSAIVVTSCGREDSVGLSSGSFNVQDVANFAYTAPEVVSSAAARVGLSPASARKLIRDGARQAACGVDVEETFCVDFDARDEIARMAAELGVDADL